MLYVTSWVGNDGFAIAATEVDLVLPYAALKTTPRLHAALAGTLNLHGEPVPVLDANVLLGALPVRELMSTRILLCPGAGATGGRRFGLAMERVTATLRFSENDFTPPAAGSPETAFAGPLARWNGHLIQRISPAKILTPEVRRQLWPESC